jgi:hypothetical protein
VKIKSTKFLVSFALVIAVLVGQVSAVFAASKLITGTVHSITLETNVNTAVTTVLITLLDNGATQTVRINIESAIALGLVILGGDGNPVINKSILGKLIEIEPEIVITDEGLKQHPVGDALATFFSDIVDLDYETIMAAHDEGTGFGVIVQALWLTRKLDGNAETFLAIIEAKKTNDFSGFVFDDGATPVNWGQFKKAVMDGKKGKPGIVMAEINNNGNNNANSGGNGNGKDKDNKKDKENNGRGNGSDK